MKKSARVEIEEIEELEPLFDYSRVQPFNTIEIDDDPLDCPPVGCKKKPKIIDAAAVVKDGKKAASIVIDCDDEDWFPPSPKVTNDISTVTEDSTRRELRLRRQELASVAKSAEEVLRNVEEQVKREFAAAESMEDEVDASLQPPKKSGGQPSKDSDDRPKIVISLQDQNGPTQYRVFKDDPLEKVFKKFAEKVELDLQSLVFVFDGDKVSPKATPAALEMEENEIIEVHVKTK
ncbi:OLC1v1032201C1 [Oldenlandia corymbosa var. corymbosa]|uniref:OLC1v1032201C1 n=1 Tax=Oldenlandia corymbosa var. corymbosa TaxID=529605 RepID=A0AAV1CNK1_OLDCO|nr:OLC1v1032201C1 [Oldenlandia corymbosa var. corymbosa]